MSAAEGTNGVEPDAITRLERAVADSERTPARTTLAR